MGINDRMKTDGEFEGFLGLLIDRNHLEGPALDITKQVIDRGRDSLSEEQGNIFEEQVLSEFTVEECQRCGGSVPWSEMYSAATGSGLCGWCQHKSNKDD